MLGCPCWGAFEVGASIAAIVALLHGRLDIVIAMIVGLSVWGIFDFWRWLKKRKSN